MVSNPLLILAKLRNTQKIIQEKKQEYSEVQHTHLSKSLTRLIGAVSKLEEHLSGSVLTEKQKNKLTEILKLITVNIARFGNKYGFKELNEAPAIVGTDPGEKLSRLEIKKLKKLKGGQELLDVLDTTTMPDAKKRSLREEARIALDAVRRREKVEEVGQIIDKTGKKAGKKDMGEIDVLTETEIIEVKGSAKYAIMDQPDSDLKIQVEKYIQKVKKDAKADTSKSTRKIVIHFTSGASNGVINWFADKAIKSGVVIEVRIGQR